VKPPIDLQNFVPVSQMVGEDAVETGQLQAMLADAESYLTAFAWCPAVRERYLGFGIGRVVALFLFRLEAPVDGQDDWLWVVTGDLPSAYFVTDHAATVAEAMNTYCVLMEDWADAVDHGLPLVDVFPVEATASHENAEMLRRRIRFLRERVIQD